MNELDTVREAFPPDVEGPSAAAKAASRRRLQAMGRESQRSFGRLHRGPARTGAGSKPPGSGLLTGSRWRPTPGRIGAVLTACGALAAVAVLGIPMLTNGGSSTPGPGPVPDASGPAPTASQFLLAAATREEAKPGKTGRFFRVGVLNVTGANLLGKAPTGKAREREEFRSITENWYPADPKEGPWLGHVDLGHWPYSSADHERWLAQKSATAWRFPGEGKERSRAGSYATIFQGSADQSKSANFPLGLRSLAELNALPTDPRKLRAVLAAPYRGQHPRGIDVEVFGAAGKLLYETPSAPKLRAAAFRVLAALPGIQLRQNVKDPIGRVGTELRLEAKYPHAKPYQHQVADGRARYVIDPGTGSILSEYSDGSAGKSDLPVRKWRFSVVLTSDWTDEKPKAPSTEIK